MEKDWLLETLTEIQVDKGILKVTWEMLLYTDFSESTHFWSSAAAIIRFFSAFMLTLLGCPYEC
jgi:hypothetical protein